MPPKLGAGSSKRLAAYDQQRQQPAPGGPPPMMPIQPEQDMPMPGGRHVTWDDQDGGQMQPQPQPPPPAMDLATIRQLPIWAWVLIIAGSAIVAFFIGFLVAKKRGGAAAN